MIYGVRLYEGKTRGVEQPSYRYCVYLELWLRSLQRLRCHQRTFSYLPTAEESSFAGVVGRVNGLVYETILHQATHISGRIGCYITMRKLSFQAGGCRHQSVPSQHIVMEKASQSVPGK